MDIKQKYTNKIVTICIAVGVLLSGCAYSKFEKMAQNFMNGLEIGMSLDDVQDLARLSFGEELSSVAISADSMIFYCKKMKDCAPSDLEENLHYSLGSKKIKKII